MPRERWSSVTDASLPWLVLEDAGAVIGYAYASRWHARSAYRHTAESTIYLESSVRGRGHGRRLYTYLLDEIRRLPIHVVVGGIALPNDPSIAFHQALGFTSVGGFHRAGWKFGRWHDVSWWEVALQDRPPGE